MRNTTVREHYIKRDGKRIKIRRHLRRVVESRDQGRTGERFKSLESKVYREYKRKGYSAERARDIAKKTAGSVFWEKYGKKSGSNILKRER